MPVLPIRPTPFFENKNRAFWNLQIAGWIGALLLRTIQGLSNGQNASYMVLMLVVAITGFSISLVLSVIYRGLINRRPIVTWGLTALSLGVGVILYALVEAWVGGLYYSDRDTTLAQLIFLYLFFDFLLLGAWTGLYYAINFFLQVEEQADRLERLEAQATSAQLAMLRYQLNPHFLFNTLNSISTLVLLKQTEPANAMLTRLSGFLRHTLVTQPGAKVTLAQEVETLKLYLAIERMRFEERLRTEFDITDDAAKACLPSMLLQPLVENAIKYAVSAQEEGARISLTAHVVGPRLRVAVADTGPGIQNPQSRSTLPAAMTGDTVSTGVGLANIRDRLAQAYSDEHLFEIRAPAGGGFTVIIEIPYETSTAAEEAGQSRPVSAGPAARQEAAPAQKPADPPAVDPAFTRPATGTT
ncbi:histidine kinase [Erythrobacter sp. LQ02-29]|uniref:sensor histidine kinase n=1 Tax=unclassified Erythrobacter TaxID=2633097 RepID=UPI001BFC6111|nr:MULTISPECIES: histidine kinase [unclassified Erythrobacter]MCP9221903.1 histidine kinase [Erythrobacter sp. LQ02-29]QWC56743.1 sensor histidine kinase [Erythrobacter sp. 3-20A1M]